jgi:mRNA interferase MazF
MSVPSASMDRVVPGDIYLGFLDPVVGREQAGTRPVLVVSSSVMSLISPRLIVCPISSNPTPWPTKVLLPEGCGVTGAVLCDQVRSVDGEVRFKRRLGEVPLRTLRQVRQTLFSLMTDPIDSP